MEIIKGGVTAAKGFQAAAAAAGIKYEGRTDMAMIYSKKPCKTAGTFTTNVVKAAPVKWDRAQVESGIKSQAVIINSGIANACTGTEGEHVCRETAQKAAEVLKIDKDGVLVGSTGVIGMQIPMEKLKAGIEKLAKNLGEDAEHGNEAAKAIMTTDTVEKEAAACIEIGGKKVTIGGMAKGSGMIHPNMCTMLAFLTTDANISKEMLQRAVSAAVVDSFNMISVDGDTSTNDTLLVLANGQAGNEEICGEGADYDAFCRALDFITIYLARKMAGDGEGATCLFEARVMGADTKEHARTLAKSVICSSLSKAAIYGHDCNFGRFLCALGYSGVSFDPDKVDLWFESEAGKAVVYSQGSPAAYSEEEATKILSAPEVTVVADMHMGGAQATAWGCDLSYDYVKINADYRS